MRDGSCHKYGISANKASCEGGPGTAMPLLFDREDPVVSLSLRVRIQDQKACVSPMQSLH